ncbi:MAG: transporter [Oscillospiraceae bacterium]|jgi:ABC-2 type transport system ATP-binding protein|nr:transporter [Oscillospiraceae bacterium]
MYALEINNLKKDYKDFSIDIDYLHLKKGCIMGFIGENGAGKSTTIKLILNLINRNNGDIKIMEKDNIEHQNEIKQQIGIVFDESYFHDGLKVKDISKIMGNIYHQWDKGCFQKYIKKFKLPTDKILKDFSRGMKMKLSIAVALSHNAKFLIMDEATSGLDPIVRDEILDVFLDFMQDEDHTIFISSHITSDLEKIADYITFIHDGKIKFSESKDKLLSDYGILKCSNDEFDFINKSAIIGYRKGKFGTEALVLKNKLQQNHHIIDNPSIEDIMLFHVRSERS